MSLKITSVFRNNSFIPSKYTCEGENVNPPLKIDGVDEKVISLAVIMDDPDAPKTFVHWVAWNILPTGGIPDAIPKKPEVKSPMEMVQGKGGFGSIGYKGPCPPRGHGVHHYHFKIYALDSKFVLKPGSTKKALERAMKGHILQQGELIGLYETK